MCVILTLHMLGLRWIWRIVVLCQIEIGIWCICMSYSEDFFDFGNMSLQDRELSDEELVSAVKVVENDRNCEKYSPIVEDIMMDDLELSAAVEKIEQE